MIGVGPAPPDCAPQAARPRRLNLDPDKVERGFARLVLVVVELIRRLLEHQALRRIEAGSLSPESIERLGTALMRIEEQVRDLQDHFGIEDLDLDLGPVGKVLGPRDRPGRPARPRPRRGGQDALK